jgi:hypothetical protein
MNTNDNQPHAERAHSKRSPSGLGKYSVCAHFKQDNDRPIHPNTALGTVVHEFAERRTTENCPPDALPFVLRGIGYWDQLRAREPFDEHVEIALDIPWFDDKKGHADLFMISKDGKRGILLDYKVGAMRQAEAEHNIQQKCYASALFEKFSSLETLEVHLAYLRLEEVSFTTFTRADLPRIQLEILAVDKKAEHAEKLEAERPGQIVYHNPDPAVCAYCIKAGICPALQALAVPTARAYATARPEDLVVPEAYDPALISDPAVMAKAMMVADVMERWVSSVKKHALDLRLSVGVEIPGTSLVSKNGSRSIIDPNTAYKVAEEHGLTHEEFMTAVDVSASKLLKAAEAKAPRGKKKLAAEALEDALRDAGALHVGPETFYLRRVKSAPEQKMLTEG